MNNKVLLFIPELIKRDWSAIALKFTVVGFCWGLVLLAILIDLHFGIRKARSIGELETSEGYRRTVRKFKDYYSVMAFALLFDLIMFFTYYFPFPMPIVPVVTIIAAGGLIFTEFKSVREKADEKLRRRQNEAFSELAGIIKNATDKETLWRALELIKNSPTHESTTNNTDRLPDAG